MTISPVKKIMFKVNHFLRIFYSKKLLRLNKKKIFNQNEYIYKKYSIQEKRDKLENKLNTKMTSEIENKEKLVKLDEYSKKLSLAFEKIEIKGVKLEKKIVKTKSTRDYFHHLLLVKIENELKNNKIEMDTLEKDIKSLESEKENTLNDSRKTKEIDELILKAKTKINQCVKKADILETRERVSKDPDVLLSLSHLTMKFGGLKAVDDLSFEVNKGEIFGLIGPNGAGKTTVFNCITQFYKANDGDIFFNDINGEINSLFDYKAHDIINLGIVRTFQNVELVWELSVLDNLLVGAHSLYNAGFFSQLFNLPKIRYEEKVITARAIDILKKLNIFAYKDVFPYGLPYGILKRIELARTLMTKPSLIILDEPAAGLNDTETDDLAALIKQLRDEFDLTIFLVEHDMGLVMDICDRICAISFGKKLAIGTPSEIQEHPKVQEAYLGGE
jgi:branched-chain amino acid transport system ATP-binding protein